jgi:hypothetical protein
MTQTYGRRASEPAYYLGRPAAIWLAAWGPRRRLGHQRAHHEPAKTDVFLNQAGGGRPASS